MGEQSNTWRILLLNDRKSRHRRIKKQRRYERLAATSQLSLWYALSNERHRLIGLTSSSLSILTLLSFGPSRKALAKAPLSGWADYTLDHLFPSQVTHTHLVSEPSPLQHKYWSGAWRRIAHCDIPEPCNHTHSSDCGHNQIGSDCLVALGFRGSPQFGCIAIPTFENSAVEMTSLVAHQALKLPRFGNFSDTSSFKSRRSKGSIGHAFTVCIRTENQNQMSFYPFVPHEISVLVELILGHLRYLLTDVPPQPNSPPDNVFHLGRHA